MAEHRRAFRLAITARALILGAMGIFLTVLVWGVIGMTFGTDEPATQWLKPCAHPWTTLTDNFVPDRPALPTTVSVGEVTGQVSYPWTFLSSPATEGLSQKTSFSLRGVACLVLCGVWGVAVWAFFGAAICRTAAVRLAADEQVGVAAALRYASRKWPAYFAAPLLPVGGVVLATIPVFLLGLIMRSNPGLVLAGIIWPLALVAGFLMAVLLLGLLFGWPLMWAAISAEGTDSFDALSRSYAYVFQRPLRYLFYVIVAAIIGWLGWLLVKNFASGVIWLAYWAAGWDCGRDTIASILKPGDGLSNVGRAGVWMIHGWAGCVRLLAVGYLFSYFWTASAAVYFLLRRDVDATEMDEVFLDADAAEQEPPPPPVADSGPAVGDGAAAEVK